MPTPSTESPSDSDVETDIDTVIAACDGDVREAIRALLIVNEFLIARLERMRASASLGYTRRRPG